MKNTSPSPSSSCSPSCSSTAGSVDSIDMPMRLPPPPAAAASASSHYSMLSEEEVHVGDQPDPGPVDQSAADDNKATGDGSVDTAGPKEDQQQQQQPPPTSVQLNPQGDDDEDNNEDDNEDEDGGPGKSEEQAVNIPCDIRTNNGDGGGGGDGDDADFNGSAQVDRAAADTDIVPDLPSGIGISSARSSSSSSSSPPATEKAAISTQDSATPEAATTIETAAIATLEVIPAAVLSNPLLRYLGPQSTALGIGSTSKYFRMASQDDGAWRHFFEMRCRSTLDLGPPVANMNNGLHASNNTAAAAAAASPLTRHPQSSSRLLPWQSSTTSFENGRQSPDETYVTLYRRLHVNGRVQVCVPRGSITCNRSTGGSSLPLGMGEDPTMAEVDLGHHPIGGNGVGNGNIGNGQGAVAGQHQQQQEEGMLRVCGNPAVEWCDNPSCRRARCESCTGTGSTSTDTGGTALHAALSYPNASPAAIGRTIIKCGWCHVRLCRACSPGNLTYCDGCNRGVCLDCVSTLAADRPLGIIRSCTGKGGSCGAGICWRCARTVGRTKTTTDGGNVGLSAPASGSGDRSAGSPARSPTKAGLSAVGISSARGSPNREVGGKFEAAKFVSEEQFRDASTRQPLCQGCAEAKVGKLNMYRRIDMSPRVPC